MSPCSICRQRSVAFNPMETSQKMNILKENYFNFLKIIKSLKVKHFFNNDKSISTFQVAQLYTKYKSIVYIFKKLWKFILVGNNISSIWLYLWNVQRKLFNFCTFSNIRILVIQTEADVTFQSFLPGQSASIVQVQHFSNFWFTHRQFQKHNL